MLRISTIKILAVSAIISSGLIGLAHCADAPVAAKKALSEEEAPYTWSAAVKTVINPHEQINDEGDVLWGTCVICHTNTPDVNVEKNINDVKLRFQEDMSDACLRCHQVKPHPAGEESQEKQMSGFVAPNHMVVPRKDIVQAIRFALKESPMMLPLEPKTGKIICSTCHNPHERGLLSGRPDYGADAIMRLRSASLAICQKCHRK